MVGSAEEAIDAGLDPRRDWTCGPERQGVKGCPFYELRSESGEIVWICPRPEKDKIGFVTWTKDGEQVRPSKAIDGAVREGPGPLNYGIQFTKIRNGRTKVVNGSCACYEYEHIKRNWESANHVTGRAMAACRIIAIEGAKIHMSGSLPVEQEDKRIIHEIQAEGIPTYIKPFPRPRDNPFYSESVFAKKEMDRERERLEKSNLSDFVKLREEALPNAATGTTDSNAGGSRRGPASRG